MTSWSEIDEVIEIESATKSKDEMSIKIRGNDKINNELTNAKNIIPVTNERSRKVVAVIIMRKIMYTLKGIPISVKYT